MLGGIFLASQGKCVYIAVMISSCDKVWSTIITLLLIINLVRYSIAFDSKESHTHSGKPNLYHTSNSGNYTYTVSIDPESERAADNISCLQSVPCKTLKYAFEQFSDLNNVKFYLSSPNFTYPLSITPNFTNFNKIGIFGNGSLFPTLPKVECQPGTGLTFTNSDNIKLESVHFHKCSASQNSTSWNLSTPHMLKIQVGLYFYNCTNVSMYQVSVIESQATGVIMYDVDGRIEVNSSNFTDNTAPVKGKRCSGYGGGGFAIEFTYCHPGDSKCIHDHYQYNISSPKRNKDTSYVFQNCYFHNNFACGQKTINNYGAWLLSSNDSHQAIGRGGGLCVYLKGDATNNTITISNCVFEHNHAVFGGGLFVEMEDNSNGNIVNVSNSVFLHNHAFIISEVGTGGGGLFVCACTYSSPWNNNPDVPKSSQGNIYIENCNFTKNHALKGGSVLLSLTRQNTSQLNNDHVITISNSTFEDNRGQLGTALYVGIFPTIARGYVPQVMVDNCSFHGNVIEYHNETIHTAGVGTIYVNEVPLSFNKQISFKNNTGSALGAVGTRLDFTKSTALFYNNSGTHGAGIALLGTAAILVGEKTVLNFTANHASQYGGAIYNRYSIRDDLKSSTHCFIHYEKPFLTPNDWTATFEFLNNKADAQGDAIFSSAILPCSFGVSHAKDIFCWNESHWNYGDSNCTEQIYTKPCNFSQNGTDLSTPIDVYPGYQFRLPLIARDDLGHEVTNDTLYYAYIHESNSTVRVESGFSHVASNYISIAGSPKEGNITLFLQTEGTRIVNIKLNLTLVDCPPGMNISTVNNVPACVCLQNLTYGEYLKCSSEEFHSFIQAGKWLGEIDGELLMGNIPQPYRQATNDIYVSLPKKKVELNAHLCGNMNRNDTLCGRCTDGYAVAINSPSYTCVPCRDIPATTFVGRLFAYIALTYGPIFLLFLAIIFLNFKLTSSAAMGFVLYAQMVGSEVFSLKPNALVSNKHYVQVEEAYTAIYGIFNLNSLSFLMKPFCLNEHFNTLDVICLDYAIAGFPLIMIALIYFTIQCVSRFRCPRRRQQLVNFPAAPTLNNEQSQRSPTNNLVHAFSAFMFLSYTKFCLASMKTMAMMQLFDAGEKYRARRISLAGQWQFTDHEFLFPYGILAIFVFIFAVLLPPFLLLGPIQLIDWLIEKPRFQFLHKIWPSIAIHTILDTFQGFYRPGCRFFGGVFVLFRLVVFISYSFEDSIDQHYAIQQIAIVVLICLIALFRPYSEDFHNHVNTLIFLNLSILNTFAIFMYADSTKHFSSKIYTLQCILVWFPLIYIICYAIWRRIHNKKPYQKIKSEVRKRFRLRLVSPVSPQSEQGTEDENERLHPDGPYNDNVSIDDDEGIFQRATAKNRYRPTKARHSSSVTYSEVDPPYCPENKPKSEEELSTGDSGAGTGTGRSSGIDTR